LWRESSWQRAPHSGDSFSNEVLPFCVRLLWQSSHGTPLCDLMSGKFEFGPCQIFTMFSYLTSMTPPALWQSRHCFELYLPLGFSESACTLACSWHSLHPV